MVACLVIISLTLRSKWVNLIQITDFIWRQIQMPKWIAVLESNGNIGYRLFVYHFTVCHLRLPVFLSYNGMSLFSGTSPLSRAISI